MNILPTNEATLPTFTCSASSSLDSRPLSIEKDGERGWDRGYASSNNENKNHEWLHVNIAEP